MPKLPLPEDCLNDPVKAHLAGIIITSTMMYPSVSQEKERADMQTVMKANTAITYRNSNYVVLLLHQIHNSDYNRRSSFNVVYSIIEKYKKEQKKKFIGNNKDLKKLWASHGSIAALSVPYAFVANNLADKEKFSFYEIEGLRYFLAVAVSVENFLTSHGNKYGVKSSFIQKDELWYVPEELNIRPEELILPLLSDEDIKELISYKPS